MQQRKPLSVHFHAPKLTLLILTVLVYHVWFVLCQLPEALFLELEKMCIQELSSNCSLENEVRGKAEHLGARTILDPFEILPFISLT